MKIEKRNVCHAPLHSKEAVDAALLTDEVVPDRTDSLLMQYPFLASKLQSQQSRLEYDNAPYYENARWLILTMSDMVKELKAPESGLSEMGERIERLLAEGRTHDAYNLLS